MNLPDMWRTDDPCPVCGTGLHATGDGTSQQCRLCGWSISWQIQMDGGSV